MTSVMTTTRIELAQRSSSGIDVSLFWQQHDGVDTILVRVHDRETGASFEIAAEPRLALEFYYHPFAYRDQARRQRKVMETRKTQERRRGRLSRGGFVVGGAES
jgi:RNase P/RNase MRP subunit p30